MKIHFISFVMLYCSILTRLLMIINKRTVYTYKTCTCVHKKYTDLVQDKSMHVIKSDKDACFRLALKPSNLLKSYNNRLC